MFINVSLDLIRTIGCLADRLFIYCFFFFGILIWKALGPFHSYATIIMFRYELYMIGL